MIINVTTESYMCICNVILSFSCVSSYCVYKTRERINSNAVFFQARTELSGEAGRHVLSLDCTKSKGESRSNEHYKRKKASRVKGCEFKVVRKI